MSIQVLDDERKSTIQFLAEDKVEKAPTEDFMPGYGVTERKIVDRENPLEAFKQYVSGRYQQIAQDPIQAMRQYSPTMPGAGQHLSPFVDMIRRPAEALVANPLMELQAGRPQNIVPSMGQALTGERTGEIGDIMRKQLYGRMPDKVAEALSAGTGVLGGLAVLKGVKTLDGVIKKGIPAGKYGANKAGDIKESATRWKASEYEKYNKGLENLPNEKLDGAAYIDSLKQNLLERGILAEGKKGLQKAKFLTPEQNKLYTAYERLAKKSGTLEMKDIQKEYIDVRGKFTKPSAQGLQKAQAADSIIEAGKDQYSSKAWQGLKDSYAEFKNKQQILNKWFGIDQRNPYLTEKVERNITQNLGRSEEAKVAQKLVKDILGIDLTGGRLMSAFNQLLRNPLARGVIYALIVRGGVSGLTKMLQGQDSGGSDAPPTN
jgi:hypothetical protein